MTHSQLGLIEHPESVYSIALSPSDRALAFIGRFGNVIIQSVSCIAVSTLFVDLCHVQQFSGFAHFLKQDLVPLSRPHSTFQQPNILISHTTLDTWKNGELENTETLLTNAIHWSQYPNHHLFAAQALVHARL